MSPEHIQQGLLHGDAAQQRRAMAKAITLLESTRADHRLQADELLTVLLPHADPIHKVTIIPRGMALGLTMQLPIDDKHSYHKEFLESQLAILMAGRIAEEIFMKHVTTGAGNDIERATDMARKMVCEWGMSDMGPMSYGKKEEQIFLGREISQHRDYSEATAIRIDEADVERRNGKWERYRGQTFCLRVGRSTRSLTRRDGSGGGPKR